MSAFSTALQFVIRAEGGYVCDPRDPGGETNMGISKKAFPNEDIKGMSIARAADLYLTNYWQKAGCDALTPALALIVFDTAVNMGVKTANDLLRDTRKAVPNAMGQSFEYTARRINRYASYKLFCTYGLGWVRRSLDAYRVSMEITV